MKYWLKTRRRRLRLAVERWQNDDGSLIAASMAYYAALSFFPLVLILISVLGLIATSSNQPPNWQDKAINLLLPAKDTSFLLGDEFRKALVEIRAAALIGCPLGVLTMLLPAIGIFTQLDVALDRVWDTGNRRSTGLLAAARNTLFRRLRAFLMLVGVGFIMLTTFVTGAVWSVVHPFVTDLTGGGFRWELFQVLASLLVNWILFTILYQVLPKVHVPWSAALRGGLLAAVLWEISRQLLALLVVGRTYTAYGVVGSLIALMFWIYIASSVFFFGAEYVRVVCDEREAEI